MPSTGWPRAARSTMAAARPASRSQPRSLTVARRPRQDHQVGAVQLRRGGGEVDDDTGLGRERVDVGDVGHPRQPDDRDPQRVRAVRRQGGARPGIEVEGVLGVEPQVLAPGEHPERGQAGHRLQHVEARSEQPELAAELVDDETGDVPLVGGLQHREGAVQGGEQPAPVDVPDDDDRQVRGPGQAHVGDVAVPQVDLGRAARALADDHVEPAAQVREAGRDGLRQHRLEVLVVEGAGLGDRLSEQHHLAAGLAARLEQHRVHGRLGLDTSRRGLHRLGAADLARRRG